MIAIVVPTIRENSILQWLGEWGFGDVAATEDDSRNHTHRNVYYTWNEIDQSWNEIDRELDKDKVEVIVVEDNPTKSFDVGVHHYSWKEIDKELGDDSWIIPRRTDCIRSFGYWKAWEMGAKVIVTMDDDCYPCGVDYLDAHLRALRQSVEFPAWVPTIDGPKPRGMPYYNLKRKAEVVLNHGLWSGVPDLDAVTQLTDEQAVKYRKGPIPFGLYYPMCGMNLAWKREVTPAMYFLLMGKDYRYDRFGDIWCGIILKRITDHLGKAIMSGDPLVFHERASDVWDNLEKEAPGMRVNEQLWQVVDRVPLTADNWRDCYIEMARGLELEGDYWCSLKKAMEVWAGLFAAEGEV